MKKRSKRGPSIPGTGALFALMFLAVPVLSAATPLSEAAPDDPSHGVYMRLVEDAGATVAAVTARLEETALEQGWEVLAVHEVAVPDGKCDFAARVLVLNSPSYTNTLMAYGVRGAFAATVRLTVFEDEDGVHVGAINPTNLNRTVVDERVPPEAWDPWVARVKLLASAAFPDKPAESEYGQFRDKGRIGRTFGIMAGGPFEEKIKVVTSVPAAGTTVFEVADRLAEGMAAVPGDWSWGIRPVFRMDIPDHDVALVGVSGPRMEADAFRIVRHGGDDDREDMECPGVDHAPAFPIEVVVAREGEEIQILLVEEMYRMKMFFEDAGKIAFAKNMGMPGSIEDEIKDKVRAVLDP